jgi:hypothetical protein
MLLSFSLPFSAYLTAKGNKFGQFCYRILSDTIILQAIIISNKPWHSFHHISFQSWCRVCGSPQSQRLRCKKNDRLSEHTLLVEQYVTQTGCYCCAYCAKQNNEHLDYTSPGTNQHESFRPYRRQSTLTQQSIQATVEGLRLIHTYHAVPMPFR